MSAIAKSDGSPNNERGDLTFQMAAELADEWRRDWSHPVQFRVVLVDSGEIELHFRTWDHRGANEDDAA